MIRRAFVTLAVLSSGAALVGYALGAGPRPAGSGATRPIVYGYPYASRCPGAGLADVVDRWGMYACNCTSYVAWALHANGQRIDWFVRGAMDAWNWPHVAELSGINVDSTPTKGAIAVWPKLARPFGHVAYVIGVEAGRTIDVAEYNFPASSGENTFDFETRSFVSVRGAVFIHVPRAVSRRDAEPLR